MSKQELVFVRVGIAFIIFVPLAFALIGASETREHRRQWDAVGLFQMRMDSEWESGSAMHKMADLRNFLIDRPEEHQRALLESLPPDRLRALVAHLKARPLKFKYDLRCIRLLGVLENYLDALDNAEASGILNEAEEHREDKSC